MSERTVRDSDSIPAFGGHDFYAYRLLLTKGKKMKKIISMIVMIAMLASFVACAKADDQGSSENGTVGNTTSESDTATEVSETVDPATQPNIPDVTYPGFTYRVASGFVKETKYTTNSIFNDTVNGEILEDAIYTRTVELEEKFDIDFEECDIGYNEVINSVLAGNNEYDLCTATLSEVMTVVNRSVVYDLYDIETLDLDKPWWDQNAEDKLSFDGHLYYTFSDFLITGMDNGRAVYFNKTMHEELKLDDLYQMVREGEWTYEKMAIMSDAARSDLNGDGVFDTNDQVGIANNATTIYEALLTGCDAEIIKRGDDGIPYFYCFDYKDRFVNVYESLLNTFKERLLITGSAEEMFTNGQVLFYTATLSGAVRMRQEDIEFGILPVPKWDAAQENYLNVSPNGDAMMIPSSVQDTDRSGVILEALSYYSSQYHSEDAVMPAYFETALTARSTRDNESAESLQIIHDNISYVIKIVSTTFSGSIYSYFADANPNITSLLKANENVQKKLLQKALDIANAG